MVRSVRAAPQEVPAWQLTPLPAAPWRVLLAGVQRPTHHCVQRQLLRSKPRQAVVFWPSAVHCKGGRGVWQAGGAGCNFGLGWLAQLVHQSLRSSRLQAGTCVLAGRRLPL